MTDSKMQLEDCEYRMNDHGAVLAAFIDATRADKRMLEQGSMIYVYGLLSTYLRRICPQ